MRKILLLVALACMVTDAATKAQSTGERVTLKVTQKQLERCPVGPYEATWESLRQNYHTPEWFKDAKFGIFIHWGVYSVPASGSEWYPKHMYNAMSREHRERWGRQREFGYKDFIPLFRAEKFDAREWAALFREAGARYVIPTAEHHDGFAMYDSRLTRWNAKRMGPRRDVIGELSRAVRAEGMKFGVSNHRIENWDFMYPLNMPADSTDLFLPQYTGLYGPPQKPTEQSGMGPKAQAAAAAGATEAVINETAQEGRHPQSDAFLNEWEMRVHELIDRYQPDLIYFDNGINYRSLDPWKLRLARYYYNSATHWGREVSIQSKSTAYLAGSILDFERESRAPKQTIDSYWQVDDPIGHKFGYVEGLRLQSADGIIRSLVDNISKNGNLCLNISPRSDGTIPDDQQQVLRTIGRWLRTYGEGVYGTRAYKTSNERNIRFTCRGDSVVYAFVIRWDGKPFALQTLNGLSIDSVTSLANGRPIGFQHTGDGLLVEATTAEVSDPVVGFKIKLKHRRRVLFIGDSITDGGWGRSGGSMKPSDERNRWDQNHLLGHGYVEMCAAHFQSTYPERDYEFLNRGISGNTLSDLQLRWQQDAIDMHPDVVSILIGTNDVDAFLRDTTQTAFDYEQWEQTYRQLIADLRAQNPQVRMVLGAPFVAKVGKVGHSANYDERLAIVHRLSDIVKTIAADCQATLVPYDELFLSLQTPSLRPDYWIWDGIHPTSAGHRRMADLWIETVNE